MMWPFFNGFSGWWMIFPVIWMVIFWGGIIFLIVWGVTRLSKHSDYRGDTQPLEIARQRYAKGEITKDQFEQIKKDLA